MFYTAGYQNVSSSEVRAHHEPRPFFDVNLVPINELQSLQGWRQLPKSVCVFVCVCMALFYPITVNV